MAPSPNLRGHSGFSLLEMMTVITLIMILASIAMPFYQTLRLRAREAVLREDLFTLRFQIDRFTHDYGHGPASLEELVDKGYMGHLPVDPMTGANDTWQVQVEGEPLTADDSTPLGVVDVHSGAADVSLEGTAYSGW